MSVSTIDSYVRCLIILTALTEPLDISNISPPVFNQDMINTLVMPPGRLEILKALANSYIRRDQDGKSSLNTSWGADLVPGKGQGQIFLLHGPPGVGKTFTAGNNENREPHVKIFIHFSTLTCVAMTDELICRMCRGIYKTATDDAFEQRHWYRPSSGREHAENTLPPC